jgi:hypothetical protein
MPCSLVVLPPQAETPDSSKVVLVEGGHLLEVLDQDGAVGLGELADINRCRAHIH